MIRTLIFSDTHLTTKFDKRKFNYLVNLVEKYDAVIINGDFWSYYSCTFDEFVKSEWKKLFPYLKNKTIYIFGNHDRKKWCDERVKLFSKKQVYKYRLVLGNSTLKILHGHTLVLDSITNETYIGLNRLLQVDKYNYAIQNLLIKSLGVKFYNFLGKKFAYKYKRHANKLGGNKTLVVGHTHAPDISLNKRYINTGYINYGEAFYFDITNNNIQLKHDTYD